MAAGLLVLVGLGLFVAGVFTDVTSLYWACVGACVLAAVLLFLARRRMRAPAPAPAPASAAPAAPAVVPAEEPRTGRHAGGTTSSVTASAAGPAADASGTATTVDPARVPAASSQDGAAPDRSPSTPAPAEPAPAEPTPAEPTPAEPTPAGAAPDEATPAGATAAGATAVGAAATARSGGTPHHPAEAGEPPVEEVEVTDLLLVVDLRDEVLVVDEHPRYHVAGCRHLSGQEAIPIPMDEARTDGFTPCGTCRPDATMADRVRARK